MGLERRISRVKIAMAYDRYGLTSELGFLVAPTFSGSKSSQIKLSETQLRDLRFKIAIHAPTLNRFNTKGLGAVNDDLAEVLRSSVEYAEWLMAESIHLVVFPTVSPHHHKTIALSSACELLGIRQVYFYPTVVAGRLLIVEKSMSNSETRFWETHNDDHFDIEKDFLKSLRTNRRVETDQRSLLVALSKNFWFFVAFQLARWLRRLWSRLGNFPRKILKDVPGISGEQLLIEMRLARNQKVFISSLKKSEFKGTFIPNNSVVFFSHLQPESTTFPEQVPWDDQVFALRMLRSVLGEQIEIFFREHPESASYFDRGYWSPSRVGLWRSDEYSQELLSQNIQILSSKKQIEGPYLVATIAGSIALERALAGFPTIVLGTPWFKKMPGILSIKDVGGLSEIPTEWIHSDDSLASEAERWLVGFVKSHTIANFGVGYPKTRRELEISDYERLRSILSKIASEGMH